MTGNDIVIEARKWLDTPFHHQGRLIGVGVDCAGLVVGVAHALGLSDFDTADYSRQPDPTRMRAVLNEHMDPVAEYQPGDVLWFAIDSEPRHLAIMTDIGIIHAAAKLRKVAEHSLDAQWIKRIRGAWRFRGIECN